MLKNDAIKLVLKAYPRRTALWSSFFEGAWYVLAVDKKDSAEGSMNPYFKVDPISKSVSEYSPTLDPAHFSALLSSGGET